MPEESWFVHPSLAFDALCLIPLLAEMPFYTSRHEEDASLWQRRFAESAGASALNGLAVLRREAYDLVPLVEHHIGTALPSRTVDLCVLRWAAPHGIRVTGVRFLTDQRYETDTVLNIAVHELLHPPWPPGHPVVDRLAALADDPFLAERFAARDLAAGYHDWSGYAEEDAAQALDQLLNTRLGRNRRGDPVSRWTDADGGMHVLALLLHDALSRGGFDPDRESCADFLVRALADRWPADLRRRFEEIVS